MAGESINTYERVDTRGSDGTLKTEYLMGSTVYDSTRDVAAALIRIVFMEQSSGEFYFGRVSLFRLNGADAVNKAGPELEAVVKGRPSIHIYRDGSRVVNASGDGDDLLRIQADCTALLSRREAETPVPA